MFTPEERKIAQDLCKREETMKFLEKLFLASDDVTTAELQKNVVALSNEQYGELMKVDFLRRRAARAVFNTIYSIGKSSDKKVGATAPK